MATAPPEPPIEPLPGEPEPPPPPDPVFGYRRNVAELATASKSGSVSQSVPLRHVTHATTVSEAIRVSAADCSADGSLQM